MTTTTSDALKALDEIEGMLISANEYWNGSQTDGAMSDALCFIETKVAQALSLLPSLLAFVDRLTAELGKAEEELSTWRSVFPDIAPASVLPDRSKLEAELLAMVEENARLREALQACADDLEDELRNRHQPDLHPASERRFMRDMDTVRDARAALKETGQ